jgi:hypothetical protein
MNERDDTNLSAEESISEEISERVRSVIAAAESAATAIRHEAEQQAAIKRRASEAERQRFIETAKAEAEALLRDRMKRVSDLSDQIIEGAEALLMRIGGALEVKRQLETMVRALAETAEQLAAESDVARPHRPRPVVVDDERDPAVVTELRVPPPPPPPPEPAEPVEARGEPVPDAGPTATETEAPFASGDAGPAQPSDFEPVEVVPDEDVEVVDAVPVDEPEAEPADAPPEGVREAAADARDGDDGEGKPGPRGFEGDDMLAARLVALQMAVAGSSRVEVEEHLRVTFSMDEPGAILNDVFGAESKL